MQEELTFIRKRILVAREREPPQAFDLNLTYLPAGRHLLLSTAFQQVAAKMLIRQCLIFSYDPASDCDLFLARFPFEAELCLPCERFQGDTIFLRVREVAGAQPASKKAQRGKERTIGEAFEKVEQWRRAYREYLNSGRKITLTEVAKEVGLPRKTLDDYYQLIQAARERGFDFDGYAREKMGTLRKFLKGQPIPPCAREAAQAQVQRGWDDGLMAELWTRDDSDEFL